MLISVLWAEVTWRGSDRQALLASGCILPLGAAGPEQAGGSRHVASLLPSLAGQLTPLDFLTTPSFKYTELEAAPRSKHCLPSSSGSGLLFLLACDHHFSEPRFLCVQMR